jgi:hypothetical protein
MPAAIAAPASTRFVAGFAPAFLDHVFRVAMRTAGDGFIGGKVAIVRSNRWMLHSYRITGGSSRGYPGVRVHLWCVRCQVLGSLDVAPQWDSSASAIFMVFAKTIHCIFSAVRALCSPECVIEFSSAAEGSSMEETDGVSLPHG